VTSGRSEQAGASIRRAASSTSSFLILRADVSGRFGGTKYVCEREQRRPFPVQPGSALSDRSLCTWCRASNPLPGPVTASHRSWNLGTLKPYVLLNDLAGYGGATTAVCTAPTGRDEGEIHSAIQIRIDLEDSEVCAQLIRDAAIDIDKPCASRPSCRVCCLGSPPPIAIDQRFMCPAPLRCRHRRTARCSVPCLPGIAWCSCPGTRTA